MNENLIAPCGMNCALCIAYQSRENDLNKLDFRRTYCPGCIPRGKNCLHMGDHCLQLRDGKLRFCYRCEAFPCKRLKSLDKRYRGKYHMSMIENLKYVQVNGMDAFLEKEKVKWRCPACGGLICCHNGLCLHCDFPTLRGKKILLAGGKGRWKHSIAWSMLVFTFTLFSIMMRA